MTKSLCSSRPLRARGLKLAETLLGSQGAAVAPPAGAWIETNQSRKTWLHSWSRPLRARGLKHASGKQIIDLFQSRPLRARGLKPFEP